MAKYTQKSKQHAENLLQEINELIPKLETAWEIYVDIYVKYENKRRLLNVYASRGIIDKRNIPIHKKNTLIQELKDYRKQRKQNN